MAATTDLGCSRQISAGGGGSWLLGLCVGALGTLPSEVRRGHPLLCRGHLGPHPARRAAPSRLRLGSDVPAGEQRRPRLTGGAAAAAAAAASAVTATQPLELRR